MKYDYKVDITSKNNAHTQCLNFIESNSKVLDIGCAVGALGEFLHKEKSCEMVGIDFSNEFIKVCEEKKCYNQLFNIDLNNLETQLDTYVGHFDYILMADVIEHVYNPEEILQKMKKYLKPSGEIVLSIPNIAHATTKFNLLKNDFKYTEMGLLDKTHIRFFTKNSIIDLMNKLQFQIIEYNLVLAAFSTSYEPVDFCNFPLNVFNYIKNDNESFIYQYVLKVKTETTINNEKALIPNNQHINAIKKINRKHSIWRRLKTKFKNLCKK